MKKTILAIAAMVSIGFGSSLFAQYNWDNPKGITTGFEVWISGVDEPKVAIDPVLVGKNAPKNCHIHNYDSYGIGLEEAEAFGLHAYLTMKKDEWTTATFSFKIRSRRAGRVRFTMSPSGNHCHNIPGTNKYKKFPDAGFCGIARISSPQFSFPAGGYFASTNLKHWGYDPEEIKNRDKDKKPVPPEKLPKVKTDKTLPKEIPGGKYLRVCNGFTQYLDVKPGKEYTISITVKPMEYYEAQY